MPKLPIILSMLIELISLILGYLLGAFSPAYFFGKMKGMDIREVGMKNAGTRNVKLMLGIKYAIPTAIYDVFKGIISILIGFALNVSVFVAVFSGFAALMGHKFPFYLQFKGGQGSATFVGIFLYTNIIYFRESPVIFYILLILVPLSALFFFISHVDTLIGAILVPLLAFSFFVYYPGFPWNLPLTIMMGFMEVVYFHDIISRKKFVITDETFLLHRWRVISRPFAILIIVFYAFFSKSFMLYLIGGVGMIFIIMDLIRLYKARVNQFFQEKLKAMYREGERKSFSSMTSYLVACFICILLFEKEIAITVIIFVTFGDLFGKLFGLAFGKHPLFHKTIEGSSAYLGCMIICVYILAPFFATPTWVLILGGIVAPIIECLPVKMNDNFTVPLISGALMTAILFFI
jgi:glycerol-3-phosphate acyltransferase PlsY